MIQISVTVNDNTTHKLFDTDTAGNKKAENYLLKIRNNRDNCDYFVVNKLYDKINKKREILDRKLLMNETSISIYERIITKLEGKKQTEKNIAGIENYTTKISILTNKNKELKKIFIPLCEEHSKLLEKKKTLTEPPPLISVSICTV